MQLNVAIKAEEIAETLYRSITMQGCEVLALRS